MKRTEVVPLKYCSELDEVWPVGQWRTQKFLMGGVHSVAYGGHLHLVCALCDVTI